MREILFRGKRIDDDAWIYGAYLTADSRHYICNEDVFDDVDPETIGQFTGLLDRNGVRIFEGDILFACLDASLPEDETRTVVTFEDYGWKLRETRVYALDALRVNLVDDVTASDNAFWTIIGNVHDNPELLEENRDEG